MEKKKLRIHRVVWLVFVLLGIFLPSIVELFKPKLEIVNYECYIEEYYEYLDKTVCEIKIECNRAVYGGDVEVAFYDKDGNFLGTEIASCYVDDLNNKMIYDSYVDVNGCVESFEIVEYSIETAEFFLPYLTLIISIPMLIAALMLSYKEFEYKGKKISVYAGFYHHTLRINGELCDEHNTLVTWSAIKLSTTTQDEESEPDKIEATISLTNRIAIKVNDKILKDKHIQ